MSAIKRLIKAVPYVRRPFYQRDAALANLEATKAELAAAKTELAATKAKLAAATLRAMNGNSPVSAKTRRLFDPQNWFLLPDEDARQDQSVGDFRTYVARMVRKDCASLEIGPSFNPILPKSAGYDVTIIDHVDQAGLVDKYTAHGVDVAKIERVDIVWDGNSMAEATSGKTFDAIVAAHVIEHAPDLIQFFSDCSDALSRQGSIYLLVPDKRYSFDLMQPLSDVAKVLGDHRAKRVRHSFECYYRLTACVHNGGRLAWDQNGISQLTFVHGDPDHIREVAERDVASESYVDAHENYFTPMSFAMIVDELRFLHETDLEVKILTRPRGSEFLAVLQKKEPGNQPTERYLERKIQGYALLLAEELERVHSAAELLAD